MQNLDPKAFWLFFIRSAFGLVFFVFIMFFPFVLGFGFSGLCDTHYGRDYGYFPTFCKYLFPVSLAPLFLIVLILFIQFLWAKLFYNSFKFELAQKGLKIEKGVVWKRYVTIPYEKIQNVDIYRGPFERLLSLSEIHVQTAGFSGTYLSEGRIPGLNPAKAEDLREELVAKIGRKENL
jgi:membrane protein YdbS with pleckstrin-like domain